jgi:hypothetical protein
VLEKNYNMTGSAESLEDLNKLLDQNNLIDDSTGNIGINRYYNSLKIPITNNKNKPPAPLYIR